MTTMNISLPEVLRSFVDDQVGARGYGTSSEYVHDLIRKDRDRQRLRSLLLEGAASPRAAVALAFIDALEAARRRIGEQPASGSPRHAHELDIPGLRFLTATEFPYLVFCVEREAEIDVWRVLHGARDIPVWIWVRVED